MIKIHLTRNCIEAYLCLILISSIFISCKDGKRETDQVNLDSLKSKIKGDKLIISDSLALSRLLKRVKHNSLDTVTQHLLKAIKSDLASLLDSVHGGTFYMYIGYGYYDKGMPFLSRIGDEPEVKEQNGQYINVNLSRTKLEYFIADTTFNKCSIDTLLRKKLAGVYVFDPIDGVDLLKPFYVKTCSYFKRKPNPDSVIMFNEIDRSLIKKILIIEPDEGSHYLLATELYFSRRGERYFLTVADGTECDNSEVYVKK